MVILLLLSAIPLFISLFNSGSIRVVQGAGAKEIPKKVSILVPMRNEEHNVDGAIHALLESKFLAEFEIIALNDQSTDHTYEYLQKFSNVKTINGLDLLDGWLGKNFACHQLVTYSTGEYLVFIDADVRITPNAIAAAITSMENFSWDFISPYPRQIALTFFERLIQPLLQWSWLSSVPLRFAERGTFPSMVIANGQFFIVKRSAYLTVGGHKAIRHEVLDDLALARTLVKGKFKGGVAEGSSLAECRMYDNRGELFNGYTKSLWRAFGTPLGAIATATYLFATGVLPILLALFGLTGAWLAYCAVVLSRYVAAIRTRSTPSSALLHPVAILTLIYLLARSWFLKSRGQLVWRGRRVS